MVFPYQIPGHKIQLQNTISIRYDTKTQTFTLTMFKHIIIKQIKQFILSELLLSKLSVGNFKF